MSDTYILYTLTGAEAIDPSTGIDYTVSGTFVIAYTASGAVDFDATERAPGYDMTITYGGSDHPSYFSSLSAGSTEIDIGGTTTDGATNFEITFAISDPSIITGQSSIVLFGGHNFTFDYGGTLTTEAVCFCPGTLITTANGLKVVEDLDQGDLILTDSGDYLPALWVGCQTIDLRGCDRLRTAPITIKAHAIAEGIPARNLTCSPSHAFLIDGILVEAGAMVNGTTISYVPDLQTVTYLHVELEHHALLLAEGTLAESFVDNVERDVFHNAPVRDEPIVEMDYPRARSARQLPRVLRDRLGVMVDEGSLAMG